MWRPDKFQEMNKRLMGIDPEGMPQRMSVTQALELVRSTHCAIRPTSHPDNSLQAAPYVAKEPETGVCRSMRTHGDHC